MYACPRCAEPSIPAWRYWSLGPARSLRCPACGGRLGVPWSSLIAVVPAIVGVLGSPFVVWVLTLAGLAPHVAFALAFVFSTFCFAAAIQLWRRHAPLIPKG